MEKRTIIALGLTIVLLFFFQMYFSPKETPQQTSQPAQKTEQAQQKAAEKTAPAPAAKGEAAKQPSVPAGKAEQKPTKQVFAETDLLKVTFTDLGGGISSVKLKKYKETVKGPQEKEMMERRGALRLYPESLCLLKWRNGERQDPLCREQGELCRGRQARDHRIHRHPDRRQGG